MTVGVLAVQGAFAEHEQVLDRLERNTFRSGNRPTSKEGWTA
ncbi:MAG: hypothetical protein WCQ23_07050 [Candidatus Methanomethylophilaceae archaeon]|jgi:glutamine amidotransferase PdxT